MCGDCVSYTVETEWFMGLAHRDNEAGGGGGGKSREVVEPVEDGRGECARCCDANPAAATHSKGLLPQGVTNAVII